MFQKNPVNFLNLPYETRVFLKNPSSHESAEAQFVALEKALEIADEQLIVLERALDEGLHPAEMKKLAQSDFEKNFKENTWPKLQLPQSCYETTVKLQQRYYEPLLAIRQHLEILLNFLNMQKISAYKLMPDYPAEEKKRIKQEKVDCSAAIKKITALQLLCDKLSQLCDKQWIISSCKVLEEAVNRLLSTDDLISPDKKQNVPESKASIAPKIRMLNAAPKLDATLESFVDTTEARCRLLAQLNEKTSIVDAKSPSVLSNYFAAPKSKPADTASLTLYEIFACLTMFEKNFSGCEMSLVQISETIKTIEKTVETFQKFNVQLDKKNLSSYLCSFIETEINPFIDRLEYLVIQLRNLKDSQIIFHEARAALQEFTPAGYKRALTCLAELNNRAACLTPKDYKILEGLLIQAKSQIKTNSIFFSTVSTSKLLHDIEDILKQLRKPYDLLSPLGEGERDFKLSLMNT